MSRSPVKSSPRDRSKRKRRVTFHPSTILCDSDHIALTITRHSFIHDKGFTQYFIKLMCRGEEWTLHKRYRDFYDLNQELMKENLVYNIDLPKLPEKRWFERQRWINRADEKYGWIRRIQLQDYLRSLVKIRVLRNESLSFWKFICMPKRVMYNTGADHAGVDDDERLSFQSSASERSNTTTGTATTSGTTGKGGRATTSTGSIMKPIERKTSSKLATAAANTDNTNTTGTTTTTTNGTIQDTPTETGIEQDEINYESDENKSAYNPEKDLELFQESVQLAASEAALRSRYGTNRTTKADIDNIAALVRTNSISTTNSHIIPTNLTNLTNSSNGSIKLNKVYDDNGEEIIPDQVNAYNEDNMKDLSYLAASNARLNVRLTSSDTLLSSPASSSYNSSNIHTHMKESNTTSNSSGIKAPVITAPTAWSNNDLATALEAINSKETFDMDLHFSGPRSGPPSVHASPNVSTTTLSESDLHRPVQILPPSSSGSGGSRNRQVSEEESKGLGSNGQKTSTLPPPPSTAVNSSISTPSSSANNSSSANKTISSPPSSQGNKHHENQKKRRSSKSDH